MVACKLAVAERDTLVGGAEKQGFTPTRAVVAISAATLTEEKVVLELPS